MNLKEESWGVIQSGEDVAFDSVTGCEAWWITLAENNEENVHDWLGENTVF